MWGRREKEVQLPTPRRLGNLKRVDRGRVLIKGHGGDHLPIVGLEKEKTTCGKRTKGFRCFRIGKWDAGLWLPFSLQIGVGCGLGPDIRLKLFHFESGASFTGHHSCMGSIPLSPEEGWKKNLLDAVQFTGQVGGLVLSQILFPGLLNHLGRILCLAGVGSMLFGENSFLRKFVSGLFGSENEGDANKAVVGASSGSVVDGCLNTTHDFAAQVSGPLLFVMLAEPVWKLLHKRSNHLVQCSVALMKVRRDYKRIHRSVLQGKCGSEEEIEQVWLDAHKKAAQDVSHLMEDLPEKPPLKPFVDLWDSMTIQASVRSLTAGAYGLSDMKLPIISINKGSITDTVESTLTSRQLSHAETSTSNSGASHVSWGYVRPQNNAGHASNQGNVAEWRVAGQGSQGSGANEGSLLGRLVRLGRRSGGDRRSEMSDRSVWDSFMEGETGKELRVVNENQVPGASQPVGDSGENVDDGEEQEEVLPLYGRADHSAEDNRELTAGEKAALTFRSIKLFAAFAPFMLLGGFMLLLSLTLTKKEEARESDVVEVGRRALEPQSGADKVASQMRSFAFNQLLSSCRSGGAAFIKWGQWSSSREDLFPAEFCDILSQLHDQAPTHSMRETRKEILKSFGRPLEEIFESFETEPLASGSVAQVHRAVLRNGDDLMPVIVKVRHPGVATCIQQDFQILKPIARSASKLRALNGLPLEESVCQFSHTMTAQTDLRVEAAHIRRFARNFASINDCVVIPDLVESLISDSVLVESFEEGRSVSHYIKNPARINTGIVTLGVDAYLRMLLKDNFVHTDLHPGNILVREVVKPGGEKGLQIVLLDFGLAEELKPEVRSHFISFLNMIVKGDGRRAAWHLLRWSDNQICPDPEAFTVDMEKMFKTLCNIHSREGINLDSVIKSVLKLSRRHHVSIDSSYAALVVGVCIIVGFATGLDPRVNLMDAATPVLLTFSLTGRVVGRLYG